MPQREFANQKALVAYAEQNGLAYESKRQRLLSPEQYEIAEVRTSRGVMSQSQSSMRPMMKRMLGARM